MAKVLVVDDDAQILTALGRGLQRVGHAVVVARTAADGLAAAVASQPEVILLDLRLPDGDGIEVVRQIRAFSQVPILLLSGAGTERTRVEALDAGADDFVDKPFSLEELRARVGAALRRVAAGANGNDITGGHAGCDDASGRVHFGDLCIDHITRTVSRDDEQIRLTPTEWRLLAVLISHPGRLLTHRQVIEGVWSASHGDEARDTLRAHLRSLRRKLGDDVRDPRFIETQTGAGYRWLVQPGT